MPEIGPTVSDLGEQGLIDLITARLPSPPVGEVWAGDDAAVVSSPERTLLTTDVLVEDADFVLGLHPPDAIGYKAIAVNVSDIAAMGGRPRHAVLILTTPPTTPVAVIEQIADGIAGAAGRFGVAIVGGDISSGPVLSLGAAMTGAVGTRPVLRSGAHPGHAICVTGELGASAAGLAALRENASHPGLIERHLRPPARVPEGTALAAAGATAMIDVTDGFARDLGRLCRASGVGCAVDEASLPVPAELASAAPDLGLEARWCILAGGEDHELIATVPSTSVAGAVAAVSAAGGTLTVVGRITDGGCFLGDEPLSNWEAAGWDHLQNR